MAAPVWPNPDTCTLAELETAMKATPHQRSFVRMQAMRALLVGIDHDTVAAMANVVRHTINDWTRRFNAGGIDALIERPRSGRPAKISDEQSACYRQLIEHPDQAGQTHWTGKKFHGYLRSELEQEVGYTTVMHWLHDQGYRLKVPQPWPDRQDEALRQAFCQRVQQWLRDPQIDLWYMDEMGVEGDPRPRRRWTMKGVKARVTKNGDHVRMNVSGIICPRTGECYALEFSHSDGEIFQCFLNQANADVRLERQRNLLIMDNAGWHKGAKVDWGRFEPIYLPPYSPDLNPIEKLWLVIKAQWFTDFVAKDRDGLIARLDQALNWAMARQADNRKTCTIKSEL